MALIECRECKKEVSDTAASCPNCAYVLKAPMERNWNGMKKQGVLSLLKLIAGLIIGLFLLGLLGGSSIIRFEYIFAYFTAAFIVGGYPPLLFLSTTSNINKKATWIIYALLSLFLIYMMLEDWLR
ncbi:MAG: hypothetical protein COA39_000095 [Sulfurimonas sp.]|nr:hypothetical protein [Sulfurimonas sp.]